MTALLRLTTMLPYGQILAGAQCLLEGSNFALSYISPNTMVDNIFTLRQPKDRSGITYMATFVGQHGFPWMVISGIYAAKGNVPAEYMLASTIASAFYALDITFRVTACLRGAGCCKEQRHRWGTDLRHPRRPQLLGVSVYVSRFSKT